MLWKSFALYKCGTVEHVEHLFNAIYRIYLCDTKNTFYFLYRERYKSVPQFHSFKTLNIYYNYTFNNCGNFESFTTFYLNSLWNIVFHTRSAEFHKDVNMELRDYQKECIDIIEAKAPGAYLCQMPTGCGKTATFTHIPRNGSRVLVLAHREELVRQPAKYYDCPVGFEIAAERSHGEDVVIASVQSLVNRLDRFAYDEFDKIITDEAHHAAASTYKKIYDHFAPEKHIGFTATPNRGDKAKLDDVYSEIIFQRDLRWAIQSGFLCDIHCLRVNIGFDLSAVHTRHGDYAPGELEEAMDGTADAIAEAYREHAKGATLVFAVSVNQAEEIAKRIPGAVVVTGKTKNRADIIEKFTRREIPCIVNVMVFTEGTDIPLVETVIIARPTQSEALYTQMVGRGLRTHPEKEKLILIDCVGVTGKASLCTAPTLIGIDLKDVPASKADQIQGPIFELPQKAIAAADCPESWIRNVQIVDLWAKGMSYNLHDVNYFKMPDGKLVCSLPNRKNIVIPCPDQLGRVVFGGESVQYQTALDRAYKELCDLHSDSERIWNLNAAKSWGTKPATESQLQSIRRKLKNFDTTGLNRLQASQILNRVFSERRVRA